jgi:site-specific DNA-cytosine methylase
MKIGILCEFSGTVRDSFIACGHDAISCDLLPTENPGPHIVGDCLAQNWSGFDLLICHPPCTHLAVSGARYFKNKVPQQTAALQFIRDLMALPVEKICIENPVSIISSRIRKPEQIIQPWQFGHPESKKTCLWLKNLPKLVPTNLLQKPATGIWSNQTPTGQNKIGPSPDRWKLRSATYKGIADAMAAQWG